MGKESTISGRATILLEESILYDAKPACITVFQPTEAFETWAFRVDNIAVDVKVWPLLMGGRLCTLHFESEAGQEYKALLQADGHFNNEVDFVVAGALNGYSGYDDLSSVS